MIFIKNSKRRLNKTKKSYSLWAWFFCTFCEQYVEKPKSYIKCESCGCSHGELTSKGKIIHGESKTKLYFSYNNMKDRCLNINNKQYKDYGGRGITICPEWTNNYIKFRDWALNNGHAEGLQINRINNDGNYEPNNCNFVTFKENIRNKRNVKLTIELANEIRYLYKTGDYTQQKLAEKYNVCKDTIYSITKNKNWIL